MKNNRLITFLFYFFLIVCIVFLILDFMSIIKIDNAMKVGKEKWIRFEDLNNKISKRKVSFI